MISTSVKISWCIGGLTAPIWWIQWYKYYTVTLSLDYCLHGQLPSTNIRGTWPLLQTEGLGLLHPCEWAMDTTQMTYKWHKSRPCASHQLMHNSYTQSSCLPGLQQTALLVILACVYRTWCVINFSKTIASDGQKLTEKLKLLVKLIQFI